jgi:hypothetical protein
MCHITSAGYVYFIFENDQNDWVVVPKPNAKNQRICKGQTACTAREKKAPPEKVKHEQPKELSMVCLHKNVHPKPGD